MKSQRFTRQLAMYAAALLLLAGGGALLGVVTTGIHSKQEQNGLQPEPPAIDRTDALSQQLAFLSLGGLRSLVAEVLTLDATDAWLKQDWPRLHRRWDAAVTLAPHRTNYWLNAAYDMTNNAAGYLASDNKGTTTAITGISRLLISVIIKLLSYNFQLFDEFKRGINLYARIVHRNLI